MRIKENLFIRRVGDEFMMVSNGPNGMEYSNVVHLSGSAAYLIEETKDRSFTVDDWADLLYERYEVDKETARVDAENLIASLKEIEVVID